MSLLPDNDPRWEGLKDAAGQLWSPQETLQKLADTPTDAKVWEDLWQHMYHQGDIGTASYAGAICLFDLRMRGIFLGWHFYALLASIECSRREGEDSSVPASLMPEYAKLWSLIPTLCFEDMTRETDTRVIRAYLSVLALSKGNIDLGRLLIEMEESEIAGWLAENC